MSSEIETLIGGPCDGLATAKTDSPHMYSGRFGDGKINVYLRREDGRLHYSHTVDAPSKEQVEQAEREIAQGKYRTL